MKACPAGCETAGQAFFSLSPFFPSGQGYGFIPPNRRFMRMKTAVPCRKRQRKSIFTTGLQKEIPIFVRQSKKRQPMKAQDYSPILEEAGIRPTSTRLLIYEAIAGTKDTFSLGSLEEQLQSVDKSVIFRTLTLFHEHRLIHSVDDGSGSLKYCLCHNHGHCKEKEEHCHFYCECCGKTYCLSKDMIPPVDIPEGFIARKMNYIIKGTCAECSKRLTAHCPDKGKPFR